MNRLAFLTMLQRYLDGTCSPEEKQMMDYWYESLGQEDAEKVTALSKEELEEALWKKIRHQIEPERKTSRMSLFRRRGKVYYRLVAAACVLAFFGLFYLTVLRPRLDKGEKMTQLFAFADTYEEKNTGTTGKWVTLEDSTRILLEPGSSLHYAKPFSGGQRTVYLAGDAFFDVAKDAKRPFMVYSGDIVTRVVGTSFRIRSEESSIEVAVITGRVLVEKATTDANGALTSEREGVVLSPNQKATYFSRNSSFTTGLVDIPALIVNSDSDKEVAKWFLFEDTPLTDVLDRLESAYGVEIILTNEHIASCPITADLSQQALYTQLEIICAVLQTTFEVKGTNIILSGGSCG